MTSVVHITCGYNFGRAKTVSHYFSPAKEKLVMMLSFASCRVAPSIAPLRRAFSAVPDTMKVRGLGFHDAMKSLQSLSWRKLFARGSYQSAAGKQGYVTCSLLQEARTPNLL